MEEKLSGEYLFDRRYVEKSIKSISEGVLSIINHLKTVSNDKYAGLYKLHASIESEIKGILTQRTEIPLSDLTIPLENLTKEMAGIAGGKIAHLGEIKNRLKLPAPDGFSITSYAFKKFMEHNNFKDKINEELFALSINDLDELNRVSRKIQLMVSSAEIPDDLKNEISAAASSLKAKLGGDNALRVSVRSSAIEEDGRFSFAGQYATFLNVPEDAIFDRYKEVIASLFTPQAIFYYKTKGFKEDMVMAVGVLGMVNAVSAGIIYTNDPNDPDMDTVIISAVRGLGRSLVDGTVTPHTYVVSKDKRDIIKKTLPAQKTALVCDPLGSTKEVETAEEGESYLSEGQIKTLFEHALSLEAHYGGRPQDIEWAMDEGGKIFILQSRPLGMLEPDGPALPRRIEGRTILIDKGVIACKGIGSGKAFIVREDSDLKDFPEGAVLVAKHTSTKFVTVMNRASAIVTDIGSSAGHMASLSREYGVPTILDAGRATCVIKDGQELTVDAVNCNIYEGRVNELLEYASKKKKGYFKGTHIYTTLERTLKWIVPLNLIDPEAPDFRPENCKTLHDITRFAHELAMAEIFKTGKGEVLESFDDLMSAVAFAESGEDIGSHAVTLRAGIPVDARLIDIDGCIKTSLKRAVPADVESVPFSAFLKGMTKMRWPGPKPVDAGGFIGMMARTASIPEEELYKTAEKSFAIVSGNYMNFSIRLGYHFSMVEAYAGENLNDNYIKFFFKGGGAAVDRRLRRVRLITEVLKKLDFRVKVTEDVINAVLTKFRQADMEKRLEVLGKLTAYTKQLDMALFNDAITDWYIAEFVREHMRGP